MAMSKKDFVLIAGVLHDYLCQDGSEEDAVEQATKCVTHDLAYVFAVAYPNFDRDKFLAAVGVKS